MAEAASLMPLTEFAKFRVLRLPSYLSMAGLSIPNIVVREFPVRDADSSSVSLLLRKRERSLLPFFVQVLLLPSPRGARAWMQRASSKRLVLMKASSRFLSPVTNVVRSFSYPAKSTKYSKGNRTGLPGPWGMSRLILKMVCPRELFAFMAVAWTVFWLFPYTKRSRQSSEDATTSSLAPVMYTPTSGCARTSIFSGAGMGVSASKARAHTLGRRGDVDPGTEDEF
mmetsp:Transcript_71891/g.156601  ORF Transcript_71891/g.156601 Transcript_71891/m.156601 type:complete len:226 (-) Transcript_71891:136-813(-)